MCLRAPVSESLSRLHREQLQKFAQYLISELPQQILPTAQRLLDELLSVQPSTINSYCGAPDPTAGASANDQTSWYLDEKTLHDNIKKILIKFCVPAPIVFRSLLSHYHSSLFHRSSLLLFLTASYCVLLLLIIVDHSFLLLISCSSSIIFVTLLFIFIQNSWNLQFFIESRLQCRRHFLYHEFWTYSHFYAVGAMKFSLNNYNVENWFTGT